MPFPKRNKILAGILLTVLAFGAFLFFRSVRTIELSGLVPDNALGYLEVNNVPQVMHEIARTNAWRDVAPEYGIANKLEYAGWLGRIARWTGIGTAQTLLVTRGQVALVISGIEVRGDDVKPHWALIIKSHGSQSRIKSFIDEKVRQLAERVYQQPVASVTEYSGVQINVFSAAQPGRQLLSSQLGDLFIIANDAGAMQSCIDTQQGRRPALGTNPLLARARSADPGLHAVFAFAGSEGLSRLSQFSVHILGGRILEGTPLAGMLEGLVSEISSKTLECMSYSAGYKDGAVVDRYNLFCKPMVAVSLREAIKPAGPPILERSQGLGVVPAAASSAMVTNIIDPANALTDIEAIVASNIGAAEAFLFHRFMASVRRTFPGLERDESGKDTLGNELVGAEFTTSYPSGERVWMVQARDPRLLSLAAEKLLQQQGKVIRQIRSDLPSGSVAIRMSDDGSHAYAIRGGYLLLGSKEGVTRMIEDRGGRFIDQKGFHDSVKYSSPGAAINSFRDVTEESTRMMTTLARRLKTTPNPPVTAVELPFSVTSVTMDTNGIRIESTSPFGYLPSVVDFLDRLF